MAPRRNRVGVGLEAIFGLALTLGCFTLALGPGCGISEAERGRGGGASASSRVKLAILPSRATSSRRWRLHSTPCCARCG